MKIIYSYHELSQRAIQRATKINKIISINQDKGLERQENRYVIMNVVLLRNYVTIYIIRNKGKDVSVFS